MDEQEQASNPSSELERGQHEVVDVGDRLAVELVEIKGSTSGV